VLAILLLAALFLAGVAVNVFGPEPNPTEAIGGAALCGVLLALFFIVRAHHRQAQRFDVWLVANAEAIRNGRARVGQVPMTEATVLTQYQAVVSFLIMTFKFPTRTYLVEHERTGLVAAICTVVSLIFGWWGVPWGPIYTVQVTTRNLMGGLRVTAGERLRALQAKNPANAFGNQELPRE
jgi:hypothetical protein